MIHLEENNLNDLIKEGTHLIDFYAQWCGPCKMLSPVLETISDKINIIKVDIDKFSDLTKEYRIMSVPTLIFIKDGKKEKEIVGFHSEEELLEIIKELEE